MSIDPAELDRIQAVCDAATVGSWEFTYEHPNNAFSRPSLDAVPRIRVPDFGERKRTILEGFIGDRPYNAEFAALARTALPLAIAALREHQQYLAATGMQEDFKAWCEACAVNAAYEAAPPAPAQQQEVL